MSKRLQVLMPEPEMDAIQQMADAERVSVGEWVRRTLREARLRQSMVDPEAKLKAIREAAAYSFPTAEIDQMLAETERGYEG